MQLKKHGKFDTRSEELGRSGRFWRFEFVRKSRMIERFRKCGRVISKLKRSWRSEEKSNSLQCNMVE